MKKIITIVLIMLSVILLISCDNQEQDLNGELTYSELAVLKEEKKKSFEFFWNEANTIETDNGYGLIPDRYPTNPNIASIASVGYGLAAYVVGVEENWVSYDDAYERVNKTLDTLQRLTRVNGFYYHFLNTRTGAREWNSEISIIDTGILLMGAITAGEYFGGEIKQKVYEIYKDVNWTWYLNPTTKLFYMGYSPESGFSGAWDHVSEQLMLYILAAGAPIHSVSKEVYDKVLEIEMRDYYGNYISTRNPSLSVETKFYYSYNGSLFQHQFSHAFIDFKNYNDPNGINWFENARLATLANYAYVQDFSHIYKSYNESSWGLTASDGPGEYRAYGAKPSKSVTQNGTIAPYGAIASINYTPKLAAKAALNYYNNVEGLWGKYGFKDAYNLGLHDPSLNPSIASKTPWIASDVIGIDKGITLLMLANYDSGIIWEQVMKNDQVKAGLVILGFTKQNS